LEAFNGMTVLRLLTWFGHGNVIERR